MEWEIGKLSLIINYKLLIFTKWYTPVAIFGAFSIADYTNF